MKSFEKKIFLFVLVIVGLLLWQYYTSRFRYEKDPLEGKAAPEFQVETLDGQKLALKDVVGKKVILLNFWATWCGPCQEEMPILNAIYKGSDPERFLLLSVMEDDEPSLEGLKKVLERFEKKIPVEFEVYRDLDGMVADTYGTYKIPESYLIDLNGDVAEHYVGAITDFDREKVLRRINELLGTAK